MTEENIYYVSLNEKKISEEPMTGEATLKIIAKPEEVEEIKAYMHKNEENPVGDKYEGDLKALFQLVYKLGTKETKESLMNMVK